jgi:exopolysaccharide biosynthesis polyprenyl glycosylphosphotransferase
MNNNASQQKHWLGVFRHLFADALLFAVAFLVGVWLRFDDSSWDNEVVLLWPGIAFGACIFGCVLYIIGLYTIQNAHQNIFKRAFWLAFGQSIAIALMLGFFYLNFSARIGRGTMLISSAIAFGLVLLHHSYLLNKFRNLRERVALIVTCAEDETEAELLIQSGGQYLNLIGVIPYDHYVPAKSFPVLGCVSDLNKIAEREDLERVLCTNSSIMNTHLYRQFCQLRYSGVAVMPLISVFEEICQSVPVELVTPDWLLSASGSPQMLYIKKIKRAFDVIVSVLGLFFLWPFLLLGMILVKVTSPNGSVFYRQTRSGQFGRQFTLYKLRSMKMDAESHNTPIWASTKDPRAIPGGNLLRKYRIDEIPQMWNVLRGEMSFVGPRPERPEFVKELVREIPYYQERLLIQPGITGWAQVNYSYGASVTDARHKLEYDLYYTKNMSLILDVFILLDTVRIILRGGVGKSNRMTMVQERTTHRS